jgi:N-acyl-D-amino-acid deacylase
MNAKSKAHGANTSKTTRRAFLKAGTKASGLLLAQPFLTSGVVARAASEPRTLLKNGLIVDGTGSKGVVGNVLIKGATIEAVSQQPIDVNCATIDCSGKVIAPGFIDAHSHMDLLLPIPGQPELKLPFAAQGCTTFVAGNCGWAAAGFKKNSKYKERSRPNLFPDFEITWDTMTDYFEHLRKVGMTHNLVVMAGHGSARTSIRGNDTSPLNKNEMTELLAVLEEAMDQGAWGVSFGLQYAPGIFATKDEIKQIAQLVAKKDKIVTVHGRAYSAVDPSYGLKAFGTPHNVLALTEMIELARETGVRVQYSHLMFAGTTSHRSYRRSLDVLDRAIADGIDIMIDSYPYHCGNTGLNVVLPKWFREDLPANFRNPKARERLEAELSAMTAMLGFTYADIQITYAENKRFHEYNGMFLSEIAKKRDQKPFDTAMELAESGGAWVLLHKYSNMEIIDALMQHPACLFMTDAVPAKWLGNPAAYGSFPLFLQYARDRKLITLEQAVRKMTGATADRFGIKDRGFLKRGLAADVTVFDYKTVKDNTTLTHFDKPPTGIEAVFMNGRQVKKDGKVDASANAGTVIPA